MSELRFMRRIDGDLQMRKKLCGFRHFMCIICIAFPWRILVDGGDSGFMG